MTERVMRTAKQTNQRTGQALFNSLPSGAANAIVGMMWDPFHKEMSSVEVTAWINNHLILDDHQNVVAVFDRNEIMWEE
jgi:hypothetical protein